MIPNKRSRRSNWFRRWLRSELGRRIVRGCALFGVTAVLYLGFLLTLPRPNTWAGLKASAERLSFRAVNPELAVFHVGGMLADSQDGTLTGCVEGTIIPSSGATIEYRRGDTGFFRIVLDPPDNQGSSASLTYQDSKTEVPPKTTKGSVIFIKSDKCPGKVPSRLPIWGPGEFGEVVRPADQSGVTKPGLLVRATLEIFAHSQERLLGIPFPSSVYSVSSFEVPAGAVLTSPKDSEQTSIWTGVAIVASESQGFSILASIRAHYITVYGPLPTGGDRASPRRIEVDDYAQFLKDPNIIQLQFLVAAFLFFFNSLAAAVRFFGTRD